MEVGSITCTVLLAYLRDAATQPVGAVPLELASHVHTCTQCRAQLALLFAFLGVAPGAAADCAPCERDLAAFVEQERHNPAQAMRWYPAVWGHLWSCAACLEDYGLLHSMAADPQFQLPSLAGELLEAAVAGARQTPLVHIYPATLNATVPAQPHRARRGPPSAPRSYEIVAVPTADAERPAYRVIIHAQDAAAWELEIRLTPPADGQVSLSIADYTTTAPLDETGTARIAISAQDLAQARQAGIDITLTAPPTSEA